MLILVCLVIETIQIEGFIHSKVSNALHFLWRAHISSFRNPPFTTCIFFSLIILILMGLSTILIGFSTGCLPEGVAPFFSGFFVVQLESACNGPMSFACTSYTPAVALSPTQVLRFIFRSFAKDLYWIGSGRTFGSCFPTLDGHVTN